MRDGVQHGLPPQRTERKEASDRADDVGQSDRPLRQRRLGHGDIRQYIRQYTYIDYTTDDWLDKLLYALPLRGLLQPNQDHNDDNDGDVALLEDIHLNENRNDGGALPLHGLLQLNEDRNNDDVPFVEDIQLQ